VSRIFSDFGQSGDNVDDRARAVMPEALHYSFGIEHDVSADRLLRSMVSSAGEGGCATG